MVLAFRLVMATSSLRALALITACRVELQFHLSDFPFSLSGNSRRCMFGLFVSILLPGALRELHLCSQGDPFCQKLGLVAFAKVLFCFLSLSIYCGKARNDTRSYLCKCSLSRFQLHGHKQRICAVADASRNPYRTYCTSFYRLGLGYFGDKISFGVFVVDYIFLPTVSSHAGVKGLCANSTTLIVAPFCKPF